MDTGINEHGYRWKIEDHSERRRGFAVALWSADQGEKPQSVVGRAGFSTRGDAWKWASRYEGHREPGSTTITIHGFGLAFGVATLMLSMWIVGSMFRALASGRVGVKHTTRFKRGGGVERDVTFSTVRPWGNG